LKYKSINGSIDLGSFIDRYWFKKHLLVQGEKGLGKTYTIDKKLTDEGLEHTFIAGHEGIESIDLLGYYIKNETGNLVWLDGVLAETFRKAKTDKCALFIDEILRIPSRELNILVGALTPSSRGTYRLRTNRIVDVVDGVGQTELLEVPMDNLWCVGTTNVGAGYQVDEIDSALSDRFRVVVKETSNGELEAILTSCASVNGISDKVITQMISFYSQVKDFVVSGELEKSVNVRHLCEVLQFSKNDDEIKSYLFDLVHSWCSTDTNGNPNKSEREIITKMIKRIFV
jgi:Holliday junction resolvasome RuvABC ATP-dependent DNA helicase subunit